jgi:acetyltransferase-like isoleucine patch superfamily enzyme
MSTLRFVLVLLAPPALKRYLLEAFYGAKIGRHAYIGWFSAVKARSIEIGDFVELRSMSVVRCGGDVKMGDYAVVSNFVWVSGAEGLFLGRHSYVGRQCLIDVARDVRIGDRSALGPRCVVYTHAAFLPYTEGYWVQFNGVTIGNGTWIAAGVFIHPGVEVGDDVFVNAQSVLKQAVPSGAVMEGFPARQITDMARLRRRMTPRRIDDAMREMLSHFERLVLKEHMRIAVRVDDANRRRCTYRDRPYVFQCVPSGGAVELPGESSDDTCWILLVNEPGWAVPGRLGGALRFDFRTMRTAYSDDPLHRELWQFMRSYYGVTFEYE